MKYAMHMIAFTTSLLLAQSFVGFPPFSLAVVEWHTLCGGTQSHVIT
jgi:hypothetical protein